MSNPFLRNKQQTAATQQPAAFSNPMPPRTTGVSAFSAPPTAFQSPVQPFTPGVQGTRGIAPPPTMGTAPPQMSNMGMPSAPPTTNVMAPPPTGSVQGSYLATKGRYQVPSNAYQFGSAMQPSQPQNMYAAEVHSESQIAPAYIGNTTTYASTAPAPAPVDASMIPDEEYMKLTYEVAPNSNSLQGLCSMPFGAIFRPMAADGGDIPIVSFGTIPVQRCSRCRIYINPFVQFTDNGHHWKCNMCGCLNNVPPEYYSQIDMTGKRLDMYQRPELLKGQVEFEAGAEYCLRPPMFPTFLFLIDVSYQSVASGMLNTICSAIRASISDMISSLDNSTINVGFITFDQSIHFYQLKQDQTPKQMVISEIEEVFLPIPSSLLINIVDHREAVESFLDILPTTHSQTKNTETCTANALQFAASLLQDCGGKIMLFQASLPSTGIGKLKVREAANILGTEAEKELFKPSTELYTNIAKLVVEKQMTVDVFLGAAQYTDVATLSSLVQTTGGQLFYYPSFHHETPMAEALYGDIHHVLSRETGFEAVFRVRVPGGMKVSMFHGNFLVSNKDLMVMPVCHADMTIALEFEVQDTLNMACIPIQSALLYTTSRGERRIRVHTMSIPISNVLNHLYERVNQDVITALVLQRSITEMIELGGATVRHKLDELAKLIVKNTKVQEVSNDPIPAKISLIPLYFMAMLKCSALRGGCDNRSDARCYVMQQLRQCSLDMMLRYLYPTMMSLSAISPQSCTFAEDVDALPEDVRVYGDRNLILPPLLNLSVNALSATGMYLLDDGLSLWMIVGDQVDEKEMMEVFGVPSVAGYDLCNMRLPLLETERSKKIHLLLDELRVDRPYFCPLKMVRAADVEFNKLKWRLIEDRDVFPGGNYSYAEFVQKVLS